MSNIPSEPLLLGWRDWVGLPDLGIHRIKAKVDTGARTSALHAFQVEPYTDNGVQKVNFRLHPFKRDLDIVADCHADVLDSRSVRDSGGHQEQRWVIRTMVEVGAYSWPIEMTLTSREDMLFRMLLGRTAMAGRCMVNPELSFLQGRRKNKK